MSYGIIAFCSFSFSLYSQTDCPQVKLSVSHQYEILHKSLTLINACLSLVLITETRRAVSLQWPMFLKLEADIFFVLMLRNRTCYTTLKQYLTLKGDNFNYKFSEVEKASTANLPQNNGIPWVLAHVTVLHIDTGLQWQSFTQEHAHLTKSFEHVKYKG